VDEASIGDSYDTELRRVVDRLRSLPIGKVQASQPIVESLASQLLECSRALGSTAPATLPSLNSWAYGDLISVLGSDLRAESSTEQDLAVGLAALTAARRELP